MKLVFRHLGWSMNKTATLFPALCFTSGIAPVEAISDRKKRFRRSLLLLYVFCSMTLYCGTKIHPHSRFSVSVVRFIWNPLLCSLQQVVKTVPPFYKTRQHSTSFSLWWHINTKFIRLENYVNVVDKSFLS